MITLSKRNRCEDDEGVLQPPSSYTCCLDPQTIDVQYVIYSNAKEEIMLKKALMLSYDEEDMS